MPGVLQGHRGFTYPEDFVYSWWAPWLLVPKLWNGTPEMLGGSESLLQRSAQFPAAQDQVSSVPLSALLPAWSTASWKPQRSFLPWARGAQPSLSLEGVALATPAGWNQAVLKCSVLVVTKLIFKDTLHQGFAAIWAILHESRWLQNDKVLTQQ